MGIAAAPIAHIKIIYEHKNEYPFLFRNQAKVQKLLYQYVGQKYALKDFYFYMLFEK